VSPAPKRRRLLWVRVSMFIFALVAVGVGALKAWLSQPFASEEEIESAGVLAEEAIRDAHAQRCVRPVLRGEATQGDGSSDLVALLSPESRFAACLSFIDEQSDEIDDVIWYDAAEALPEDTTVTEGEDEPPPPDAVFEWHYPPRTRRLHTEPLPMEREIITRCAGLDVEVERIVQHSSVCTPFPLGSGLEESRFLRLIKGLVILARDRLQRGEARRGFELLLDAEQLALDAQRGRPHLVGAMIGVVSLEVLHAQVQWLLLNELPWTETDLLALTQQAVTLSAEVNRPDQWAADALLAESFPSLSQLGMEIPEEAIVEPSIVSDEAAAGVVAYAFHAYSNMHTLCEGVTTQQECAARFTAEEARVVALQRSASRLALAFPNIAQETFHASMSARWLESMVPLIARACRSQAARGALPLLFMARRLALDGRCPTSEELAAEAGALLRPTGLGGQLEVLSSNIEYEPLDICAPQWLAPEGAGRVRLPLLDLYCPVFPLVSALH
jgi:hypothetical protein